MIQKIASIVLFIVLILSAFFILTSSPKSFVQNRPATKNESVKMSVSSNPISYHTIGSYEANHEAH